MNEIIVRNLGLQDYQDVWQDMREFTDSRTSDTADEIWLVEHPAVFTLGQRVKREHLLNPGDIPIIQSDRGGQVTYHGPGQQVAYVLLDLKRHSLNVRQLVSLLENSIIDLLATYQLIAASKCDAPGVYIDNRKIASVGLRIRRGYSYHGLAFNVAMDLEPFSRINPCGFAGLEMTQLRDWHPDVTIEKVANQLIEKLLNKLIY